MPANNNIKNKTKTELDEDFRHGFQRAMAGLGKAADSLRLPSRLLGTLDVNKLAAQGMNAILYLIYSKQYSMQPVDEADAQRIVSNLQNQAQQYMLKEASWNQIPPIPGLGNLPPRTQQQKSQQYQQQQTQPPGNQANNQQQTQQTQPPGNQANNQQQTQQTQQTQQQQPAAVADADTLIYKIIISLATTYAKNGSPAYWVTTIGKQTISHLNIICNYIIKTFNGTQPANKNYNFDTVIKRTLLPIVSSFARQAIEQRENVFVNKSQNKQQAQSSNNNNSVVNFAGMLGQNGLNLVKNKKNVYKLNLYKKYYIIFQVRAANSRTLRNFIFSSLNSTVEEIRVKNKVDYDPVQKQDANLNAALARDIQISDLDKNISSLPEIQDLDRYIITVGSVPESKKYNELNKIFEEYIKTKS